MPSKNYLKIAAARLLAFDILMKVEAGGYASDLLLTHSASLDARDGRGVRLRRAALSGPTRFPDRASRPGA